MDYKEAMKQLKSIISLGEFVLCTW